MIKDYVSDLIFEKYTRLLRDETLNKNQNLRWCPRPDCPGYAIAFVFGDSGESLSSHTSGAELTCNTCSTLYCFYCGEMAKPESKHNCRLSDKPMDYWFKKGIRHCPNCKRKVEKNYGCDHMTCIKCKFEWCWLCGESYFINHFLTCEIELLRKLNPSWRVITALILAPIMLFLVLAVAVIEYWGRVDIYRPGLIRCLSRYYCITYPLTIALCLTITPPILVLTPLAMGVIAARDMFSRYYDTTGYCFITFVLEIGFYPLSVLVMMLGVVRLQIAGIALAFKKINIILRRCTDLEYLLPKSECARKTIS